MAQTFLDWTAAAQLSLGTFLDLDHAVVAHFHDLFFNGEAVGRATALLAALVFCDPRVARRTPEVPRARRALKGFGAPAPSGARLPLPRAAAALIITKMPAFGSVSAASMTMPSFAF